MLLYPLKFRPRLVEKMWGGRKLQTVLGKALPPDKPIGESWELYDFPPGVVEGSSDWVSSEIANGPLAGRSLHWAVGEFGSDLYGLASLAGDRGQFPILIKFLDAREDLSVQVHPDEKYASANPGAHLKSEAWYVLQSDPGSRILNGLQPGTTKDAFEKAIENGTVEQIIESVPVHENDCFYLPSGTVHALGAGILVAEVQTPSDTTFRVFDFNRVDPSTGQQRSLHVKQALQCIDFFGRQPDAEANAFNLRLVTSPYFHLQRHHLHPGADHPLPAAEPIVLIVTQGAMEIETYVAAGTVGAARGEVILIPAGASKPLIKTATGCAWLQVSFPGK